MRRRGSVSVSFQGCGRGLLRRFWSSSSSNSPSSSWCACSQALNGSSASSRSFFMRASSRTAARPASNALLRFSLLATARFSALRFRCRARVGDVARMSTAIPTPNKSQAPMAAAMIESTAAASIACLFRNGILPLAVLPGVVHEQYHPVDQLYQLGEGSGRSAIPATMAQCFSIRFENARWSGE